ncbi:SLAM family member 5-like isoform X2 [Onychostoma macrolepis]|uniref:SLAM family member 5-like isoform X2 n=1 Tax=Onychostoma macrolepis TaxID=369639 RepID=UPI00272A3640|nr:SLAM family member 5-like isoform X2 [Onychostoma macrolepis]
METFVLFCVTLLVDGVFGYTDEVKSVSVMEGDSVTLFTDLTEIQKADLILWAFGSDSTRIVQINRMANKISLYEDVLDGRFRDRLKVDHQTGSLIITNITTQHTGLYRFLQIIDRKEVLPKKFSIIVSARLSVPVISSNHSQCSSSSSSSYCSLLCSVVNVGHVTLSWYKGNSLLSSISVSDLSISLSLPLEVEYQDKNTYSCVLNNPISNQTRHLDISKLCQPCSAPGLSAVHIALVCVCALAVAAVLCGIYYYCQRKTRKQADKGDELDGEELKNIKSVVPGNNGDMHQPNHADGETSNEGRHLKNDAVPLLAVEVDGGNASVQEGDLETTSFHDPQLQHRFVQEVITQRGEQCIRYHK